MSESRKGRHVLKHFRALVLTSRGCRPGQSQRETQPVVYWSGVIDLLAHTRAHVRETEWYRNALVHPTVHFEASGYQWIRHAEPIPTLEIQAVAW